MELGYIFYYLSSSAHLVTNKNPESHQFYHQFSWLKKKIKFLIGPKRLFFPLSFNKSLQILVKIIRKTKAKLEKALVISFDSLFS